MQIRTALESDIDGVLALLSQVLEIHADIRPDIFIHGTTKYTKEELKEIIPDQNRPIYVAVEDNGNICGYAFCVIKDRPFATTMHLCKELFIDDLCVDENCRGTGIGKALFEYVKSRAKEFGCGEITLAVWSGNDKAYSFYKKLGMTDKETIMEYRID